MSVLDLLTIELDDLTRGCITVARRRNTGTVDEIAKRFVVAVTTASARSECRLTGFVSGDQGEIYVHAPTKEIEMATTDPPRVNTSVTAEQADRRYARDRVADRGTQVGESGVGDGRDETARERLDRNLSELNGEMRVVVTGVQVLFAFLLVAPFDSGFARLDSLERDVYFATLLLATFAAVCTIGPAAQHRVLFRRDDKAYIVSRAESLALAGLAFLAMAMCGALLLVATYLFGLAIGIVTAAAMACLFAAVWFAGPMRRARQRE